MNIKTKLKAILETSSIEPFIRHIRFPFYKNLTESSRIDFKYPITALVGQNGTNKSSVLRALYGSPNNYSLGNLWFSTDVDVIQDGGRSRFIYGYYDSSTSDIVEVIKSRISKGSDPDYWEPSRPLISDGMKPVPEAVVSSNQSKTRWKAIEKGVIYLDFRATISAFDKFFYHSDFDKYPKKEHLRKRSQMVKEIIDKDLDSFKPFKGKKEKIFNNIILDAEKTKKISEILGREYISIRLIEHALFTNEKSSTIILQSPSLRYSEAFAGSGEFAVAILVNKLLDARACSLVLLDEPEVSLHPSAQMRLMDFLQEQCLKKKHQIVVSTHSPSIVKNLPKEAIKLFCLNENLGKVDILQDVSPEESFYILGENPTKKTIIVEDKLAKKFVEKSLKLGGDAFFNAFDVRFCPGGAKALINNYAVPLFQANVKNVLFLLDGDQITQTGFLKSSSLAEDKNGILQDILKNILGLEVKITCDGNSGGANKSQKIKLYRDFIDYAYNYISYLPILNPENFIIENPHGHYLEFSNTLKQASTTPKEMIVEICKKDIDEDNINSDNIFETQIRMLNRIPSNNSAFLQTKLLLQKFLDDGIIR